MFLIAKNKAGYQAIPIRIGDRWDFHKVLASRLEVRIVFRHHGRRYLLYSTRTLTAKYPRLKQEHLIPMCDELITKASDCIAHGDEYIDFGRIVGAAECRHHAHWRDAGLIPPVPLEQYHGHPIDPKTEQLASYVRVDLENIIVMDHEPPINDCVQEDLPY